MYLKEIKYEFLKLLRLPSYALPTLAFPILFYLFFGIGLGDRTAGSVTMASYLLATYGAFGVIGASLFGFGVTVAVERGQGWLELKRTTPMPIGAYFLAKMVMAMLFSSIIVLSLFALGRAIGNVQLTLAQGTALFAVLVAGSTTFCALGLAIGYFAGPNSAAAVVNVIYLPLGFLSGLWIPVWMLPRALQDFAYFLPPFHFSQLALRIIGASRGTHPAVHILALVAFTGIFLALAWLGYRRDEGKLYG